jgi:hypothetical protein
VALWEQRRAERERRRRHAILALAGGLVVVLVLALLAGGQWQRAEVEVDARATAQAEAETAEGDTLRQASIGLTTQALNELQGKFPERASPLALEALEAYPYTWQADSFRWDCRKVRRPGRKSVCRVCRPDSAACGTNLSVRQPARSVARRLDSALCR